MEIEEVKNAIDKMIGFYDGMKNDFETIKEKLRRNEISPKEANKICKSMDSSYDLTNTYTT